MNDQQELIYPSIDQAQELVERIEKRVKAFGYTMHKNEMQAMAELLSDTGVSVGDLLDVSSLADNYPINAEIVGPEEVGDYENIEEDSLFQWEEEDGTHYCYRW